MTSVPSSPTGRLATTAIKVKKLNSVVALFEATIDQNAACGGTQSKLFLGNAAARAVRDKETKVPGLTSKNDNRSLSSSNHNPLNARPSWAYRRASLGHDTAETCINNATLPSERNPKALLRGDDDDHGNPSHHPQSSPDVTNFKISATGSDSVDSNAIMPSGTLALKTNASDGTFEGDILMEQIQRSLEIKNDVVKALDNSSHHGRICKMSQKPQTTTAEASGAAGVGCTTGSTTTKHLVPSPSSQVAAPQTTSDDWSDLREQMVQAMATKSNRGENDDESESTCSDDSSVCSFESEQHDNQQIQPGAKITNENASHSPKSCIAIATTTTDFVVDASETSMEDFGCTESPTRSPRRSRIKDRVGGKSEFHDSTDNMHADNFITDFEEQRKIAIRRGAPKRNASNSLSQVGSLADRMKAFQQGNN